MCKIRTTWLLTAFFSILPLQISAQPDDGFEELYKKADDNIQSYLHKDKYGPVTPVWNGTHTFYYQTEGVDSIEYYKVDLVAITKTQVPKDTLESYRTPERQRGPWGGPGGGFGMSGFPGRADAGLRSPDGNWECLVRDHNIWVRNIESKELTQLSFDGNEKDY